MSWYRQYRPRAVSQLHLTQVRERLQQFMAQGQIPQVLLFAGPKGTGKTSSARILGAVLNDPKNDLMTQAQFFGGEAPKKKIYVEPDPDSEFNAQIFSGNSFVVQEMDAASNRGIDDVRALKERVSLPPQMGKINVYILDEAHMLTTEAFNALLKLLEEPPRHAVFILATTELHKIPDTIKSRCALVQFRRATEQEITEAISTVLKSERVTFEGEAVAAIAAYADGSFRDAVKIAELATVDQTLTLDQVNQTINSSSSTDFDELISLVMAKDSSGVAKFMVTLRSKQVEEKYFIKSLLLFLHRSLLQHLGVVEGAAAFSQEVVLFLLKELSLLPPNQFPAIPFLQLELKLLEIIERAKHKQPAGSNGSGSSKPTKPVQKTTVVVEHTEVAEAVEDSVVTQEKQTSNVVKLPEASNSVEEVVPNATTVSRTPGDSELLISKWSELLQQVKQKNVTLEALLRSAKPLQSVGSSAQVAVYYRFHKEQLEQPRFKSVIDECAANLAGGSVKLEYILSDTPPATELVEFPQSENLADLAEEVLI